MGSEEKRNPSRTSSVGRVERSGTRQSNCDIHLSYHFDSRLMAANKLVSGRVAQLLPHLSPPGWEHTNLTGDYI